jgi:hypothetical protein
MKRSVLLAALLASVVSTTVYSQDLRFGVKAGLNLSNMSITNVDNIKYKPGFVVGVTLDIPVASDIYVLTGLELSQKGFKLTNSQSVGTVKVEEKLTTSPLYLQLPVHIGYKIEIADGTYFVPQAGPYLAYGLGGKGHQKFSGEVAGFAAGTDNDYALFGSDGGLKNLDLGIGVGFGLEIDHINLNIGYDIGLINVAKISESDNDSSAKNGNLFVTVGYKF